ncbi:uncharacterized protein LOC111300365 isoform X2 [Durio zibethinus]|nr:uncharacterized protein LOC111300365 isoform X2 [Durio zibethinus]
MPGTIQVSVLDFKGPHSSSPSSEISVKVSMGKREYQTWDKGEFSFPLTTLRDNLIITLQDAEGNEISHTGVETRLVVEKGVWDDIFSLEGGGHVHMKLQFVLSEEERQRIRIMRESAVKKKRDELCNSGHGSPKSASVGYNEVSGSQESFFQNGLLANEASLVSVPLAKFYSDRRDRSYSIQKQKSTNDRDENEGNTSAKSMSEAVNVDLTELYHQDSVPSELEKANNSKKQGPAGKAHSNIRKMITAFEDSLNQVYRPCCLKFSNCYCDLGTLLRLMELDLCQDVKPSIKPPPQIKNIGMDSFLANSHLNEVETDKIIPSKVTLGRINTKEFEQTKISIREKVQTIGFVNPIYGAASSKETEQWKESTVACIQTERKILDLKNRFKVKQKESDEKEEKKYSEDFRRASTIEKAAFSHRMLDKHPKGNQSWNLFSKRQHSRTSLVTKESGDKIFQRDTREAERTSNEKLKTMAIFCGDHCSFGSSDLWIFPGEAKCLCITTGGKQIMDLMGGFWDETNTHQRKLSARDPKNPGEVNTDAGTAIKANEDGQTSKKLRPKVENSMDPEDSIGPVGQVIRVVIMVGFATLVLITRKRR